MLVATCLAILVAGCLIGVSGIGGILVVPALTYVMGVPLEVAIATASCAFVVTGAMALVQSRSQGGDGSGARPWTAVLVASVPGALLGAMCVGFLPGAMLLAAIAALSLASGTWGLLRVSGETCREPLGAPQASLLGAAVGFGSAMTGTGGPVLLAPALVMLRQPIGSVVRVGQVIQLPIALCATAAHLARGHLDIATAVAVAALLVVGMLVGGRLSSALDASTIRRVICWLLVAVGVGLGTRLVV